MRAVPFVELPPGPFDRQPHAVELIDDAPHRPNGPLEHRSVDDVEVEALLAQQCTGGVGLAESLLAEVDVDPTGEPTFSLFQRLFVRAAPVRVCSCTHSTGSRSITTGA